MIEEEKKEVLQFIKELTEKYLIEPNERAKRIIEDQTAYYKRLLEYNFNYPHHGNQNKQHRIYNN